MLMWLDAAYLTWLASFWKSGTQKKSPLASGWRSLPFVLEIVASITFVFENCYHVFTFGTTYFVWESFVTHAWRMCPQKSFWVIPVICCCIRPLQIGVPSPYQCQRRSIYLCSTPSAVASGHNLSADSGTIFGLHLSPALMAKSASCIKNCLRKIEPKEEVVSVLDWDHVFASCSCLISSCFTE